MLFKYAIAKLTQLLMATPKWLNINWLPTQKLIFGHDLNYGKRRATSSAIVQQEVNQLCLLYFNATGPYMHRLVTYMVTFEWNWHVLRLTYLAGFKKNCSYRTCVIRALLSPVHSVLQKTLDTTYAGQVLQTYCVHFTIVYFVDKLPPKCPFQYGFRMCL